MHFNLKKKIIGGVRVSLTSYVHQNRNNGFRAVFLVKDDINVRFQTVNSSIQSISICTLNTPLTYSARRRLLGLQACPVKSSALCGVGIPILCSQLAQHSLPRIAQLALRIQLFSWRKIAYLYGLQWSDIHLHPVGVWSLFLYCLGKLCRKDINDDGNHRNKSSSY